MREITQLNITCNVVLPWLYLLWQVLGTFSVQVKLVYEFLVSRTSIKSDKLPVKCIRIAKYSDFNNCVVLLIR